MKPEQKLEISLLCLRLSVFVVMLMWTIDKFVRPEHAAAVYEHFYFIGGLTQQSAAVIGALELLLLSAFVLGYQKRISYGIVLVIHGVSTLSSWQQYLSPFEDSNLLFFAAIPMLAACFTLYLLREQDRLWTIGN